MKNDIFKCVYDQVAYVKYYRCLSWISKTLYFRRLTKYLRIYIRKYHLCQLNQIRRHRLYEELILIRIANVFFYIIVIDFILSLLIYQRYNILLTIIDKFTKSIDLISDKNIWFTIEWAHQLFQFLMTTNWNLLREMIFDRDSKFISNLWHVLFEKLKTRLLTIIVYYSQEDDQTERANQTTNIALRYFISQDSNIDWINILSSMQF